MLGLWCVWGEEMTERYYVCANCGELITETVILEECASGGQGMCWCEYCDMQWSEEFGKFEPVYFRKFSHYTEIPKKVFDGLKEEENTVLRLKMFRTVPEKALVVSSSAKNG